MRSTAPGRSRSAQVTAWISCLCSDAPRAVIGCIRHVQPGRRFRAAFAADFDLRRGPGRRGRYRASPPTEPDLRALPYPVPRASGSLRHVAAHDPQASGTATRLGACMDQALSGLEVAMRQGGSSPDGWVPVESLDPIVFRRSGDPSSGSRGA